jgi:Mrp family chromosome partitioning ATPase
VIVDSPPSGAVVDACLIARSGCSVLFVMGANHTSRRAADAALRQLSASGARVAGAVVNRVAQTTEGYPYAHNFGSA